MGVSRGDSPRRRAKGPCIPTLPRRRGVVPSPSCSVRATPRPSPRVGAPLPPARRPQAYAVLREQGGNGPRGGRTRGRPDDRQAEGWPRVEPAKGVGVPEIIRFPSDSGGAAPDELNTRSKELQRALLGPFLTPVLHAEPASLVDQTAVSTRLIRPVWSTRLETSIGRC